MNLKDILEKIKGFNTNEEVEDGDVSVFFDEIGVVISNIGELEIEEKKQILSALFDFLGRQSADFEENWSFIHLIENIDDSTVGIYYEKLFKFNKKSPTLTSILLLNRLINALETNKKESGMKLLGEISKENNISPFLREEAADYYTYQLKK